MRYWLLVLLALSASAFGQTTNGTTNNTTTGVAGVTVTGPIINGDCTSFAGPKKIQDAGGPCGTGTGPTASPQYQTAIYPNAGTTSVVAGSSSLTTDAAGDFNIAGGETATSNATNGAGGGMTSMTAGLSQSPIPSAVGFQAPESVSTPFNFDVPNASVAGFFYGSIVATGPSASCTLTGSGLAACATSFSAGSASGTLGYAAAPPCAITGTGTGGKCHFTMTGSYPNFVPASVVVDNPGTGYTGTPTAGISGLSPVNWQDIVLTSASPITGGPFSPTSLSIGCTTCTTNAAALTSTAVMTGGGGQASQTPSATTTLNSSGNLSLAGTLLVTGQTTTANGTCTNPGLVTSGSATFGIFPDSTTKWAICSNNTHVIDFGTSNIEQGTGSTYAFSQTASSNGTIGATLGVIGSGATEAVDTTGGASTTLINTGNKCTFALTTSTFTLALSPVPLCTGSAGGVNWGALPNAAKTWRWSCEIGWSNPAGTTPTFAVGVNWAQAPSAAFQMASIDTTNAGVGTQATTATTTNANILATGTLTTSATIFQATFSGTFTGSATSGTFSPTVSLTGTSATGTAVGGCWIF